MQDEVIAVYEKVEDIYSFRDKLKQFSFGDLIKHPHFYYSLDEKGTDLQLIKEKFVEFDRIQLIVKRRHSNQKITHSFHYVLDDNSYIIYAVGLDEKKPFLLNAFYVQRSFKKFKQSLRKSYGTKFVN